MDVIKASLAKEVEKVVREAFPDGAIDAVQLEDDWDEDGEPIIWVTVVFRSGSVLDVRKRMALISNIRPVLAEQGTSAFPVVSYRSKSDHDKLSAAA